MPHRPRSMNHLKFLHCVKNANSSLYDSDNETIYLQISGDQEFSNLRTISCWTTQFKYSKQGADRPKGLTKKKLDQQVILNMEKVQANIARFEHKNKAINIQVKRHPNFKPPIIQPNQHIGYILNSHPDRYADLPGQDVTTKTKKLWPCSVINQEYSHLKEQLASQDMSYQKS